MTGVTRTAVTVLLASALATPVGSQALADRSEAARSGAAWLADRQTAEGALPTYSGSGAGELIMALLAGGLTDEPVDRALAYVASKGKSIVRSSGQAGRLVLGLVAAGADPRGFRGTDYTELIRYDETTGAYDENMYANALAALGVLATDGNLPGRAVTYIRAQQCVDGGFAWRQGCAGIPDVDTTSMAVSALRAAGIPSSDTTLSRARSYLLDAQNTDGGFGLEKGDMTNANSTSLAISAIRALGEKPWDKAMSALQSLQNRDGGFKHKASDGKSGDYATVQGVLGLMEVVYPMRAVDRSPAEQGAPPRSASPAAVPGVDATDRPPSRASGGRAGVIVVKDGELEGVDCLSFEDRMTGEQLLERADIGEIVTSRTQLGAAVCKIGDTGCTSGDCFCEYPAFWNYWTLDPPSAKWVRSDVGASDRIIKDGSIDAWVWSKSATLEPEPTSIENVCSVGTDEVTVSGPAGDDPATGPLALIASFLVVLLVLVSLGAVLAWRRRKAA